MVVVLDDDIDIFDEQEVLWAILTRSRRDSISIIENARGRGWPGSEQIIVDATYVAGDAIPLRNRIPPKPWRR